MENMEKTYQKNLQALKDQHPKLGAKLEKITSNPNFDVFYDQTRLNAIDLRDGAHIYADDDYMKLAEEFLLEHGRKRVLFAYGIGLGVFYKILFERGMFNHIVIFEPDLELLYIAFHLVDFSYQINVDKLFFMDPFDYDEHKLSVLCNFDSVSPFLLSYFLYLHSDYYARFADNIKQISHNISNQIKHTLILYGNCPNDSLVGIKNNIINIENILHNIPLDFFGKQNVATNRVCVIASTGPSLRKQLPLLKQYQDRVMIFCPDASYPILMSEGIVPDMVCSLERVEESSEFYKNAKNYTQDKNTAFVLASLVHKKTISNLAGKNIILTLKSLEFEKGLDIDEYGYIGGGQSAAYMAAELAVMLGYTKLCFIGQDLAYGADGSSHSVGHVYSSTELDPDKYDKLYVPAYGGKGEVMTHPTWFMFRQTFELFFARTAGVEFYNATQGGARINNTKEIPFDEFLTRFAPSDKKQKFTFPTTSQEQIKSATNRYETSIKSQHKIALECVDMLDNISLKSDKINAKLKTYEKQIKIENFQDEISEFLLKGTADNIENMNRFYNQVDDDLIDDIHKLCLEFLYAIQDQKLKKTLAGLCGQRIFNCTLKINQILSYPQNTKEQYHNNTLLLYEYVKYYSKEFCGYIRVMYEVLDNETKRIKDKQC